MLSEADRDVSDQLDGSECPRRDETAGGRELHQQADDAEQVDVGVVNSEVDEHSAGAAVQPQVLLEVGEDRRRLVAQALQVLHVAATLVRIDVAPVIGSVQVRLSSVHVPGTAAQMTLNSALMTQSACFTEGRFPFE